MSETPVEESGDEESDVVAGDAGGSSSFGGIENGAGEGRHRGAGGGGRVRRSALPSGSECEKPHALAPLLRERPPPVVFCEGFGAS